MIGETLIGEEVWVGVSEPWNFEGPDGQNRLQGRVVRIWQKDPDDVRSQRLELEVTPFCSEEGAMIDRLVAGARYVDERGIVQQIAAGERAAANLSYSALVPDEHRLPGVVPKLIGSVSLSSGERRRGTKEG